MYIKNIFELGIARDHTQVYYKTWEAAAEGSLKMLCEIFGPKH